MVRCNSESLQYGYKSSFVEALSILSALLPSSLPIQKIVAFSGAFDNLLTMIEAEGGTEGGVVVQDALGVLTTLLRGNLSNQV
jgi:intracellular protein transport protein USO1